MLSSIERVRYPIWLALFCSIALLHERYSIDWRNEILAFPYCLHRVQCRLPRPLPSSSSIKYTRALFPLLLFQTYRIHEARSYARARPVPGSARVVLFREKQHTQVVIVVRTSVSTPMASVFEMLMEKRKGRCWVGKSWFCG